jgi:hypothetical protein
MIISSLTFALKEVEGLCSDDYLGQLIRIQGYDVVTRLTYYNANSFFNEGIKGNLKMSSILFTLL